MDIILFGLEILDRGNVGKIRKNKTVTYKK
jgi:hypothetical protein